MPDSLSELKQVLATARAEVARVIIGQENVVDMALLAILTNQHVLLEGVPGVAKTLLVRTLARVLGCEFNRIQFTPDLMPADITGTSVFDLGKNAFSFVAGPVFTTFLLADEINRAPAKTQSALLQAMQERTVSVDRQTYSLPENFTVFATQNPVESEGTYPLPEAQRDRFLFKVVMPYPDRDDELTLARRMLGQESPEAVLHAGAVKPVVDAATLTQLRAALTALTVREELLAYAVDIVRATRGHEAILVGAGPRATQSLIVASRAFAALQGRDFVTPDDLRSLARPILEHRLVLRPEFELEGLDAAAAVAQVLDRVPVPR